MTAIANERKRTTATAAVLLVVLALVAAAMSVVGVFTLANSKEGEAVGIDDRPRESFPATPNGLLAIHDGEGQLTSLIVMTLLPEGQGGSIVTIPVNADVSAGFGLQRRPLDESFDPDDVEGLVASVEEMLSITIQRASVLAPEQLATMLEPVETLEVVLPHDVIDSSAAGDGIDDDGDDDVGLVVTSGLQTLTRQQIVEVLTAWDDDRDAYEQHETTVQMWTALARTAPIASPPEPVTTDDLGRPVAPASAQELRERMWQGDVGVRDIATVRLVGSENPTDEDVVLLDRRDTALVFAQISPGLVSSATTGMRVRVVAPFTDEQLAAEGYASSSEMLLDFIGTMMFVQASVVSIDSAPTGAADVTIVEAAQPSGVVQVQASVEALFGPSEVRLAESVIDGVDLVVTLGTGYLSRGAGATEPDTSAPDTSAVGTVATNGTLDDG